MGLGFELISRLKFQGSNTPHSSNKSCCCSLTNLFPGIMINRKQRKGNGKVKTGRKLCISLFSVLLLATLTTLVLLGVKQRCPELGLCNCLYATMLTFGASKLESAILRGDAQLAREMIDDSAQMMAPFTLSLPGEEPKVSTFDVPIGGIGRNRSDKLRGVVYHPNSTARDVGDLRCIVIFLHGGGWVVGSVFESSQRAKDLAKASDLIVVSLQYRLSPEYVFPSQLNDVQVCYCILNMLVSHFPPPYQLIYVCHYYLLSVVYDTFVDMLQNGVEIQNVLPWRENQQGAISL